MLGAGTSAAPRVHWQVTRAAGHSLAGCRAGFKKSHGSRAWWARIVVAHRRRDDHDYGPLGGSMEARADKLLDVEAEP